MVKETYKTSVFKEIWAQLTLTPSFESKHHAVLPKPAPHLELVSLEIEKAFKDADKKLVFLITPSGMNKTDYVQHFIEKHWQSSYIYKSFMRVADLDFAFLHLTNYIGRLSFLGAILIGTFFMMLLSPNLMTLSSLLLVAYFFAKPPSNIFYVFHELIDNLSTRKNRLFIIDDIEKSGLDFQKQGIFLANLWENKRRYLISVGYSVKDKDAKLKIYERVLQLGGIVVEAPLNKEMNEKIIDEFDSDFPFSIKDKNAEKSSEWLSLLDIQDLLIIREQSLSLVKPSHASKRTLADKKTSYINFCLGLLSKKIGLENAIEVTWSPSKQKIEGIELSNVDAVKRHYLDSFAHSIKK